MDNFRFRMTCEGTGLLADALKLVWSAKGMNGPFPHARPDFKKPGATHYAIRQPDEGEKWTVEDRARHPHLGTWQREPKPLRLVFYDNRYKSGAPEGSDQVALPFTLDAVGAADFASRWLAEADYGNEPDHDGDNGKGWTVYNEGWGHVDNHYSAIIAIAPQWAMYGK